MKAKELKVEMLTGALTQWAVSQINKIPMTRKQHETLWVEIAGVEGRVDTTDVLQKTNYNPADYNLTLHFAGVSCRLDGAMVYAAMLDDASKVNRRVEIAEGVRHPNV